jgi:Tfp pilus assembly protein PilN
MGRFGLNLSTRPFPAYRAVNLGLIAVLIVLIGVSGWQAYSYVHFTRMASRIRSEAQAAREKADALKVDAAQLKSKLDRPEAAAKLKEIEYLNNLIARKNFSWTRVFSVLEQMIPENVHLTSLRPEISTDGKVVLHVDVRGKSVYDVSDFVDILQKSQVFDNVVAHLEEKKDAASAGTAGAAAAAVTPAKGDVDVTLTMSYHP